MKKLFFAVMALAVVAFTACDNTEDMTDSELQAAIEKYQVYGGEDSDGDYITAIFPSASEFHMFFGKTKKDADYVEMAAGTWAVSDGALVLSDTQTKTSISLTIEREGKRLVLDSGDYSVTLKKRKSTIVEIENGTATGDVED